MNLQKEFKKETGMNAYINRVGRNTMYHQSYTKWLETKLHEVLKLNIPVVVNWVATNEAMPPKDGLYYCLGHGSTPFLCNYRHGQWWRQTFSKKMVIRGSCRRVVGIKYWRNLPDPPCL